MRLPPISEGLSLIEVTAIASWHQDRADNEMLSQADRDRHSLIAFRLFTQAHRGVHHTTRKAA